MNVSIKNYLLIGWIFVLAMALFSCGFEKRPTGPVAEQKKTETAKDPIVEDKPVENAGSGTDVGNPDISMLTAIPENLPEDTSNQAAFVSLQFKSALDIESISSASETLSLVGDPSSFDLTAQEGSEAGESSETIPTVELDRNIFVTAAKLNIAGIRLGTKIQPGKEYQQIYAKLIELEKQNVLEMAQMKNPAPNKPPLKNQSPQNQQPQNQQPQNQQPQNQQPQNRPPNGPPPKNRLPSNLRQDTAMLLPPPPSARRGNQAPISPIRADKRRQEQLLRQEHLATLERLKDKYLERQAKLLQALHQKDPAIRLEGPFVLDLVTNQVAPDLSSFEIKDGTYKRMDFLLAQAVNIDTEQPLFGNTFFIGGYYKKADGQEIDFQVYYPLLESVSMLSPDGLLMDPLQKNQLQVIFDMNQWFEDIDFQSLVVENGVVTIDRNHNIRALKAIRKNLKHRIRLGKDNDGDGKISSDEQVGEGQLEEPPE